MPDQSYYLTDDRGELAIKRLIRFESLAKDLWQLADELELPNFQLRHINKTKSKSENKSYQDYYDASTEKMVRNIYKRDFDLLGYECDL